MYKVELDSTQYVSKKRKTWENQLYNDLCVRLNGMSWEYKTLVGAINRVKFLTGQHVESIDGFAPNNYLVLKGEPYGTQRLPKKLPGICTGYVDLQKVANTVEKMGVVRLPFTAFYDARVGWQSLGLDKCYITIRKI